MEKKRRGGNMEPHRGTTILVLSIAGFFCCIILSLVALNMANTDLQRMEEGTMDPEGEGLTKAGKPSKQPMFIHRRDGHRA